MGETLGYISLVLYALALLFENPRKSFWCSNLGSVFFIAQCIYSSMVLAAIGPTCLMFLTIFILRTKRENWKEYIKAYAVLITLAGVSMAGQGSEYLVVAGSFFSALSRLGRDQFYVYRSLSSAGNMMWFMSFYMEGMQSFMLMSAMLCSVNMVYMVRHAHKHGLLKRHVSYVKSKFSPLPYGYASSRYFGSIV